MPKTPDFFDDETILITSGASGIGRATAAIFAREGANVILADIDGDGPKSVAEDLRASNVGADAVTVDVTIQPAVDDMIAQGIETFGRIDYLFNSAGSAGRRSPFLESMRNCGARHMLSRWTGFSTPCNRCRRTCWKTGSALS